MFSEQDARLEIDEALRNKGWILTGKNKNVLTEVSLPNGRADYILQPKDWISPLIVIEAKKKGKDLNTALTQACSYAKASKAPIVYASDGSTIKTIHMKTGKPLLLNDEEIDQFIDQTLALKYLDTNEYNTLNKKVIQSRRELITIFSDANKELRKEGLAAGIERFSEFCNILFLKIFSEQLERAERGGYAANLHHNPEISAEFRWDNFKRKNGQELLSYVNDTVIRKFSDQYGKDIFEPLQLKNPVTLKKIIDNLDPLSLVDTNSDIKGDAFEYFLKAYLANQNKDLGEYFTPRHIVKTLVKLINPKFGEKIYDPFCGTGGMLIESFKHIYNKMPINERSLDFLKKETIFGGEITKNARITKMNMILTGDGHNNIVRHDSLNNPVRGKYDIVITNMPFSLGSFGEYSNLYKLGSAVGNSLCIEHCFDAIKPKTENDDQKRNPRIGMIVPEGILFDRKFTKLRDFIYRNSIVQNIVSLPQGAFKPYTDVKTSILYLTNIGEKKPLQRSVWHFEVKNDGLTLNTKREKKEGVNDIDLFLSYNNTENDTCMMEIGFNRLDMKDVEENNYVSIPNPYKTLKFESRYMKILLGTLIEESVLRNSIDAEVWSVTNNKGFMPAKDKFDERVASKNTEKYKIVLPEFFSYNPSRVNVGSIAFNDSKDIGCVSPMYIVFKIVNEVNKNVLNPRYLYWLLQAEQFKAQVRSFAFGSVRQTVSFSDFCKIAIPLPKVNEQEKIVRQLEEIDNSIKYAEYLIESLKILEQNSSFTISDGQTENSIMKVSEISTLIKGITPKYGKSNIIVIKSGQARGYDGFNLNQLYYLDKEVESNRLLKKGDILVNTTGVGTAGRITYFDLNGSYVTDSHITAIRIINDSIIPKYVYITLSAMYNRKYLEELSIGSTGQIELNKEIILNLSIPIPNIHMQEKIVKQFDEKTDYIKMTRNMIEKQKKEIKIKLESLYNSY